MTTPLRSLHPCDGFMLDSLEVLCGRCGWSREDHRPPVITGLISFDGQPFDDAMRMIQEAIAPLPPHPWWLRLLAPGFNLVAWCSNSFWYYGKDHRIHWFNEEEGDRS
jgi:hypothetical protein